MNRWLKEAIKGRFILCISPEILAELQKLLEQKLRYSAKESVKYCLFIESFARIVHPTIRLNIVRDPDDNKILECAVEAKATAILTFDKDLLELKEYEAIKIIHPRMLKYWFPPGN